MSASESDANMMTQDSPQEAFAEDEERRHEGEDDTDVDEVNADDNRTLPKEASAKDNDSVLKEGGGEELWSIGAAVSCFSILCDLRASTQVGDWTFVISLSGEDGWEDVVTVSRESDKILVDGAASNVEQSLQIVRKMLISRSVAPRVSPRRSLRYEIGYIIMRALKLACYAFEHFKDCHRASGLTIGDLGCGCEAKVLRAEEEARLLEEQKRTEVPTSPLEEPVKAELLTEENFK